MKALPTCRFAVARNTPSNPLLLHLNARQERRQGTQLTLRQHFVAGVRSAAARANGSAGSAGYAMPQPPNAS